MQVRFLLGPAGSGKTWRCLQEIRAELIRSPEGPPLLWLVPKQATFQLERQLLSDPDLHGYTRLQILSFDRLAQFVLEHAEGDTDLLDDEGRVMVLRALLGRRQADLKVFHATARLPGFSKELGTVLRELQEFRVSSARLREIASHPATASSLAGKLHDLALLMDDYRAWLEAHQVRDGCRLLDAATDWIRQTSAARQSTLQLERLWLDGFADLTPQELELLAAIIPRTRQATLAFCLPHPPAAGRPSSADVRSDAYRAVRARLSTLRSLDLTDESVARPSQPTRFSGNAQLTHLEENWFHPTPLPPAPGEPARNPSPSPAPPDHPVIQLFRCHEPEDEVRLAARAIRRHVRAGGRFRDAAVLVRSLDPYHAIVRRLFRQYDIPCFIDRREAIAHHPLVELTRYALRTLVFGWRHEDWFGALKTGLFGPDPESIDQLENEALANGWEGRVWLNALPNRAEADSAAPVESLRRQLVTPMQFLARQLTGGSGSSGDVTGERLAAALESFWQELGVDDQLAGWASEPWGVGLESPRALHLTVWEEVRRWLGNLRLAFAAEAMPLTEWLPILEAGLSGLTVGLIPPAIDQVIVGSTDRSRSPELELMIVLGLNELVFPAAPMTRTLLTESDREQLESAEVSLGPNRARWMGREAFLGYIALTRARSRLMLTYSEQSSAGNQLNPSPFVGRLKTLFPALSVVDYAAGDPNDPPEHVTELAAAALRWSRATPHPLARLDQLASVVPRLASLRRLAEYRPDPQLSPEIAAELYGPVLRSSVSALEQFGACPMRFFIAAGLHAQERKTFEVDARERGTFQHEILAWFHRELANEGRRWRDLTPEEGRQRIRRIAERVIADYRDGLFQATPESLFTARSLAAILGDYVAAALSWMPYYGFDPAAVELSFGGDPDGLPSWDIPLAGGRRLRFRGTIDRIDLAPGPAPDTRFCVIIDYKSSPRLMDPVLLHHGIQMQLPAYLAAIRQFTELSRWLGARQLIPAGVFYVNLRPGYPSGQTRTDVLDPADQTVAQAYQMRGRFTQAALQQLDRGSPDGSPRQIHYRLKKDGTPYARNPDLQSDTEFRLLLDRIESLLRDFGDRIYAGDVRVDPYEHRGNVACDHCEFQGICRIDPWVQSFRALTAPVPPRAAALTDPANPARPPSRRGRKAAASAS